MVVETLWPETAPWWLNLFIWMATFWQYILIGFVPAFYIAVVQLFGMPLLQRWRKEVVIIMHPTSLKFGKIEDEKEPYFTKDKGVYWRSTPLNPDNTSKDETILEQMAELKKKYEDLSKIVPTTKKIEKEMKKVLVQQKRLEKTAFEIKPVNQLQIFTQSINQPIYNLERMDNKARDLLSYSTKTKNIKKHGVWIMQNPVAHFHRHYKLIIDKSGQYYKLIPVKERQMYSIGFWHSVGIERLKEVEQIVTEESTDGNLSMGSKRMVTVSEVVTTAVVTEQVKMANQIPNFSSSKCWNYLQLRKRVEYSFFFKLLGIIDVRIILALGGMVGAVIVLFVFMHGGGGTPGGFKI